MIDKGNLVGNLRVSPNPSLQLLRLGASKMTDPSAPLYFTFQKDLVRKWQANIVNCVDMVWRRKQLIVLTVENDQRSEPRCLLNVSDSDFWAISQVRIKALGF